MFPNLTELCNTLVFRGEPSFPAFPKHFFPYLPMRTTLFFLCFLLFGINSTAQELICPDRTLLGTLASFEIVPAQEASWHIVTPSATVETYQADTGLAKLYFASPQRGRFTIIAGIVTDGKPQLLVKTFINGEEGFPRK